MLAAIEFRPKEISFELLKRFGFVNCYIKFNQSFIKDNNFIYLVFNPSQESLKDFHSFYDLYSKHPNFIDDFCIDHNIIVLVFKVADKWIKSYEAFKKSRYSEMDRNYANLFKYVNKEGKLFIDYQYYVIYKDKSYRKKLEQSLYEDESESKLPLDAELESVLDNREILDYKRN